jgi:hypothetical protein
MSPFPPRSKRTDELVRHIAQHAPPALQAELGHWMEQRSRFRDFVSIHRDKIRKKVSTANGQDGRLDVRAELLVAYLVLGDRRFELAFEAYGAARAGPDLSATYRENQRFNLEVTRLRTPSSPEPDPTRIANAIAAKVRQLPAEVANALVITTRGLEVEDPHLAAAIRLLKARTDARDDDFFERRGLRNARDFYAQYLRLSSIYVLDERTAPPSVVSFANREARRPLSTEIEARLAACWAAGA